jgi:hypothetical protein
MSGDMLQRGARMLERVRSSTLAHAVEYGAGNGGWIGIDATTDGSDFDVIDQRGVGIVERSRDFLFNGPALTTAIGRAPETGDRIRETIDGQTVEYEVREFAGLPAYRFEDILNLRIRVHTRRKGVISE